MEIWYQIISCAFHSPEFQLVTTFAYVASGTSHTSGCARPGVICPSWLHLDVSNTSQVGWEIEVWVHQMNFRWQRFASKDLLDTEKFSKSCFVVFHPFNFPKELLITTLNVPQTGVLFSVWLKVSSTCCLSNSYILWLTNVSSLSVTSLIHRKVYFK